LFPFEQVSGVFSILWNSKEFSSFTAGILNLSAGGLQFVLKRDDNKEIRVGERLLLKKIKGDKKLTFLINMDLEIKWILDIQYLEHMGVGCAFHNISGGVREKIGQFVDSETESRGQTID
jgi:c-di-GMP-binding flagellar brake protein YcgR